MGSAFLVIVVVVGLAVLIGLATLVGALDADARSTAWRRIADGRRDLHEWEQDLIDRESTLHCPDCPSGARHAARS